LKTIDPCVEHEEADVEYLVLHVPIREGPVGHKTEAIYRWYAIVDAGALRDAALKIDRAATGRTST
jgi:hypothetical protein